MNEDMKTPAELLDKSDGTAEVSTAELLADVTRCIIEGRQFTGLAQVMRRTLEGRLTEGQLAKAQRLGYEGKWSGMMEQFRAGQFFGQQGLDFLSWLMVTEAEVDEDHTRWLDMKCAADALGLNNDERFKEAEAFATERVTAPHSLRRVFLTKGNGFRFDLSAGTRKTLKQLRDGFRRPMNHGVL